MLRYINEKHNEIDINCADSSMMCINGSVLYLTEVVYQKKFVLTA